MVEKNYELDFKEGRWPLCDDSPLSPDMLDDYITKFGNDRAMGYIDAVLDFQKHFQRCYTGYTYEEQGYVFHQRRIGAATMIKKLFHRNSELLKKIESKKFNLQTLKHK